MRAQQVVSEMATHLMSEGLRICGDRRGSRFYANVLDAQADVDDSALDALSHCHSADGIFVRQVIADHGMEELLWWHVIRGLSEVIKRAAYIADRGSPLTCSIQCFPFAVTQSLHFARGIRR
jgi:hypothetical protein